MLRAGSNRFSGLGEYWTTRWSWIDRNGSSLAGTEILSLWDGAAQLGGPIRRDRLWFFSGAEVHRQSDRPLGYGGTLKSSEYTPRALVKLTAAPGGSARLEGHGQLNRQRITAENAGRFTAADALNEVRQADASWNVRFTKPIGARMLIEARTGGYASHYSDLPLPPQSLAGPPAMVDDRTYVTSGNASLYRRAEPLRSSSAVTITRMFDGRAGGHELRHWARSTSGVALSRHWATPGVSSSAQQVGFRPPRSCGTAIVPAPPVARRPCTCRIVGSPPGV